ncbi:hypothetical protein DOK67_0000610 [Enterococcus sp. DIV0212c]|uniref:DUF4129 domain-containing transglutaminase family protein n=1 Tax=Enterococcus sp. DIV0212c TaxID=2230867 RepID=UPI001A9BE566|nr:transglutaminase domain-containing protein [Enterococcus sp. DIV0212c]MBO1354565.1 transglutaminase domain-containing protein [Enterococcus sp. DIV0212c]
MKTRIKQKWPFAILSFFMLAAASLPFLNVYHLKQTNSSFFIGILALICFITLIIKRNLIRFPLYLFSYLFTLYCYFPLHHSFGFTWLGTLLQKNLQIYVKMLTGEVNYLPDIIALSIILFLLILLAVLFIQYERWTLGYLLLISYLFMLAVFNQLNFGIEVMIITSAAVLFYGLKRSKIIGIGKEKRSLVLLSGFILFLIAGSAYIFLLVFPQTKNVIFTQTAAVRTYMNQQGIYQHIAQYGSEDISSSGFSNNDTQLGGPLNDDQTVVFTAKQKKEHYWRVETKYNYTGKGWNDTSESAISDTVNPLSVLENQVYKGAFGPEMTITLSFNNPIEYLPYPYGNVSATLDAIGQTEQFQKKQRINLLTKPKTVQLTWQEPEVSLDALEQVPYQPSKDIQTVQIPTNMPKQIQELAISLTENQDTLYGKVKAIEHYLKMGGGYRYSKVDTPFTPENEDYVDYFLFESKVGYCDNFSSAMTIMLRSLGISSRWAKGFSSGTMTSNKDGEYSEYTIRNNDAHSWTEVYFEGYGWLPFEPTPSFTNNASPSAVTKNSTVDSKYTNTSTESSSPKEAQKTTTTTSSSVEKVSEKAAQKTGFAYWHPNLHWVLLGLLILLAAIGGFFLHKYFFLLYFSLYRKVQPKQFTGAYMIVLHKAEQILYRQANEPLTHYAKRFEQKYPHFEGRFIQLTEVYEQTLYGDAHPKENEYTVLLKDVAKSVADLKKEARG